MTLFRENGIEFERVDYFVEELTAARLKSLFKKAGIRPFEGIRKSDPAFKANAITDKTPDAKVIELMVANPGLIQRPILEVGGKAVIARPAERAFEIIA